ncbi:prolyl aminopeptidase [Pseudomaricurvus alkylphenolicus]|uniref:prolyl aminopeptidase n=1 Tax=Pseudomaricurvus alkylphenolicus TaxID=1306991 RepID=UPI00141E0EE9|nr:prolyl aminopeptidase [Pseudomaricurvus alkylphenolicus]NIB42480.1 prolyl aminopeptidase [Pseudomaricurvus alkylphenolicus]
MRRLDDPYYRLTPALDSGHLDRGDGHKIYWEESGNPQGVPLLFVHGGPGGRNAPNYRVFMDPERFRIIQFDQRGCGKSEPLGCLDNNTLQHTLADMEALRQHFGVDHWVVAGGSWGSTVTLAYGEAYPQHCLGLLLVSLWLCRKQDMDWWYQGVETVFPELWETFASLVPAEERQDLRTAFSQRILHGKDTELAEKLAKQLYLYEEGFMRFDAPLAPPPMDNAVNYGRIFSHYAANNFFLEEGQLLRDSHRIENLPVVLITGRYDMCTTPNNAYALYKRLHNAELTIVPGAGHNPTELALSREGVKACVRMLEKIDVR